MLILEPDGTVAHDTTAAQPAGPLDVLAELLAPSATDTQALHYTFDVGGLGTVALEIEQALGSIAGIPHRFVMSASRG
jgi:hypothetical protein